MSRPAPEEWAVELAEVWGSNLKSVLLYGSAVGAEDYSSSFSDCNLLVIAADLSRAELKKASVCMQRWVKTGNAVPLLFTEQEFKSSSDVFPLEFLDMRSRHKILWGYDPLQDLTVQKENLRLELERELKGKWLRLRCAYVQVHNKPKALKALLAKSLSTFAIFFRGIIWLADQAPSFQAKVLFTQLAEHVPVQVKTFILVWQLRKNLSTVSQEEADVLAADYFKELEKVVSYLDTLKGEK